MRRFGEKMLGWNDKMCVFGSFIILVLSQLASGQRIFIKETKMYEGKTGRVTCHIESEGHTINDVQWELQRNGTTKTIYIYWAQLADPKDPKSWLKGRSDYEHLPDGNSTLIIQNVTPQDEGSYTCQVKFDGNPKRTTGQVLVITRPPKPILKISKPEVKVGESVTFSCSSSMKDTGGLQYDIRKTNGGQVGADTEQRQGSYTILKATTDSQGDYVCVVTNDAGASPQSDVVSLRVKGAKPETSKKIVIIIVVVVVVVLLGLLITWIVMCIKCPTACPQCCREKKLNKPFAVFIHPGWVGTKPGDKGHSDFGETSQMNAEKIVAKDVGENDESKPINV